MWMQSLKLRVFGGHINVCKAKYLQFQTFLGYVFFLVSYLDSLQIQPEQTGGQVRLDVTSFTLKCWFLGPDGCGHT